MKQARIIIVLFFCLVMTAYLPAQEKTAIISEGFFVNGQNVSLEEGYQKAKEDVRNNAVEKAFGISSYCRWRVES